MPVGFAIKRDIELIEAGTHFFCLGHLEARPLTELSDNPKYCRSCYQSIKADRQQMSPPAKAIILAILNAGQPISPSVPVKIPVLAVPLATGPSAKTKPVSHKVVKPKKIKLPTKPKKNGRPREVVPKLKVKRLRKKGLTIRDIAKQLGLSPMTVSRALNGN